MRSTLESSTEIPAIARWRRAAHQLCFSRAAGRAELRGAEHRGPEESYRLALPDPGPDLGADLRSGRPAGQVPHHARRRSRSTPRTAPTRREGDRGVLLLLRPSWW